MRAFVAVVPPPRALAALVPVVESLRAAFPGVTWVPQERLHVTLAFLGEVSDETAARVASWLAEAVRETAVFDLCLSGGGAFPRAARPNVLWAGLGGDLDALRALARRTRRAARAAGVDVERAEYVPHVTVARVRRRDVDGRPAVDALRAVRGEPWTVTEAVLMRSTLGPHPSYDPVARAALSQAR